jgi:hypothetical protein
MSNSLDAYIERERRLAVLLMRLQAAVNYLTRQALMPESSSALPNMAEELRLVTGAILPAFSRLSGLTVAEIEAQLKWGGQSDE